MSKKKQREDLQDITQKAKVRATRIPLKTGRWTAEC